MVFKARSVAAVIVLCVLAACGAEDCEVSYDDGLEDGRVDTCEEIYRLSADLHSRLRIERIC